MQYAEVIVLFGILIIKICVEVILTLCDPPRLDCVIKAREMFTFLPLINSSVTIGLSFFITKHISYHITRND